MWIQSQHQTQSNVNERDTRKKSCNASDHVVKNGQQPQMFLVLINLGHGPNIVVRMSYAVKYILCS